MDGDRNRDGGDDREMIISLYRPLFICVSIFIYKILLDM